MEDCLPTLEKRIEIFDKMVKEWQDARPTIPPSHQILGDHALGLLKEALKTHDYGSLAADISACLIMLLMVVPDDIKHLVTHQLARVVQEVVALSILPTVSVITVPPRDQMN